ncbi:hypothetical protein QBC33DRAFT_572728 [Phialemonium atrogriseum]|uniref:Protein kinase domain-containing protein n=1 Tax=Phialemonium atrogriseum TaxID=1093897 RepID=A0AAJ0FE78_9PEZI|nr:uncharacterized protein QBC33DRAFT_572728 [Phialemonium atrogriseum]KAK1764037.1 hypothetical protein QBC33DRAFT_572728 [Phialemonium atrogriseum]
MDGMDVQPPLFQAPEVILGVGRSYSADIWNLGVLVWNLLENTNLFPNIRSIGLCDPRTHLAAMIAWLGNPPKELLEREEKWANVPWKCSFPNPQGKPSCTAPEFIGGPFFDSEDLVPTDLNIRDSVSSLQGDDNKLFLDFVGQMLNWLLEKRKTAKVLLDHPWLGISR